MKESYNLALKAVLEFEGGYVNHPKDPGGKTYKGVTQRTYDSFRKGRTQDVRKMSEDELKAIYRNLYWNKVQGDLLPVGVDLAVFDFAVNSGVSRAAKVLQGLVGVPMDGVIGPQTIKAAQDHQFGLVDKLCDSRMAFLRSLKTFPTFGRGWTNRVTKVRAISKNMRKIYSDSVHN